MKKVQIHMSGEAQFIPLSDGRISVSVPITLKQRRRNKSIVLPNGETLEPSARDHSPTPLQWALVRGYRWLSMLELGEVRSIKDIAQQERCSDSYISRMLNLTTLAPDIVAAILDGTFPPEITLLEIAVDPPALWEVQRDKHKKLQRR